MARNIAFLFLFLAYGSCMETRETVERTVMVRTTGSDLQPAATGYIYKKESDGPVSVVKMGASEVMEHLSKLYEKPEAYAAPVKAAIGPYHAKENDGNKAASHASEAYIKPVVEKTEEKDDEHNDGIANEDYGKIFGDYASHYDGYKKDFADYLKGFEDGLYKEQGGGKDYGSKGHHEYGEKGYKGVKTIHHYGKGDAGDYESKNHKGFAESEKGGYKKDYDEADAYEEDYAKGHGYKGGDHGNKKSHSKGEEVDGYHKIYDKNVYTKVHDFYDGKDHKGGHHKLGNGHAHHGSDVEGFNKGESDKSGHHEGGFGKGGFADNESGEEYGASHSTKAEGGYTHLKHGDFGAKGGKLGGKGYGYEIKH